MNENHLDRFPGVTSRQPDRGLDVVFVSLTGGGRSQIAAALTTLLAGDNVSVHAAGTAPGGIVDPVTAAVIAELGVDISEAFARPVDGHLLARASVIVTMGHAAGSFVLPVDVVHQDWRVGDPVAATLEEARRVKDDIERRVTELLLGLDALAPTS
jgi:protein-tyrosine-phosphatase